MVMDRRWRWLRVGAALAVLVMATFAIAACGGGDDNDNASTASAGSSGGGTTSTPAKSSGKPIKFAGLFTKTPQPFGQQTEQMVKKVFDDVNAAGGVNGSKIEYSSADDATNPQKAAQAARQFVEGGAVAMVGTASFVDCGVNNGYYKKQGIVSIPGIGTDPFCFGTPNIAPVNVGPFTSITADLYYSTKELKNTKPCAFITSTPGTKEAVQRAIQRWTTITGAKLLVNDSGLPFNQTDFTPELLRAKKAGCDAIFYNGGDTVALSILKSAKNQGMQDVDFLFDAPAYTEQLAKSASGLDMHVYLASEFEPFTAASDANADWAKAADEAKIPKTSFSQGGYIAAMWAVDIAKQVQGDVTREAFTKAAQAGKPFEIGMVGTPLVFGPGDKHAPNQAVKMVTIKDGVWDVLTPDFLTLPGNPA